MNWRMKSGGFQDQAQHGVYHCFTARWVGDTGMKFTTEGAVEISNSQITENPVQCVEGLDFILQVI